LQLAAHNSRSLGKQIIGAHFLSKRLDAAVVFPVLKPCPVSIFGSDRGLQLAALDCGFLRQLSFGVDRFLNALFGSLLAARIVA
jgi:hypothetical protein